MSLPGGEIVLITEAVLPELLAVLHRDAGRGYRRSPDLSFAAAMVARAVTRIEDARAISPSPWPASLPQRLGVSGAIPQVPQGSASKVVNLDQAAALLGTGRERARQLVREHELACWPNPDGRHELLVWRAEVIALAELRRGGHGTGEEGGDAGPGGADSGRAGCGGAAA
jgi:hypothetical protein